MHTLSSEPLTPGSLSHGRSVGWDDKELTLLARASRGDRTAISRLVEMRRDWVARLARRYDEPGQRNDELESEAMIGLLESIAGYRGEGRAKFVKNMRDRITQRLERLTEKNQRQTDVSAPATSLQRCWDMNDDRVEDMQVADTDAATLEDITFRAQIHEAVHRLLEGIPHSERRILCGRFGLAGSPITMVADLARELKMTCEAVSLRTDRLLRELRERLEDSGWSAEMFR